MDDIFPFKGKLETRNEKGGANDVCKQGLVAQWITRLTTDQKIPGSNPGKLDAFFFFLFSTRTLYLVSAIESRCVCT